MTQGKQKCWKANEEQGGMASASAPTGLNNNLQFMGKQLHVQTENMEFPVAHIVTQVFCGGRVVLSKKSEYPAGLRESRDFSTIQRLMQTQHHQILREITEKQTRILGLD
jgi:hypothetical protein